MNIDDIRSFYAEEIAATGGLENPAVVRALATVPRERFLGPGPWQLLSSAGIPGASGYRQTADADPRHVYHNVPVALDPSRQINNGQPSLIASWIDALDLSPGKRAVHIGCGTGYFTALMAEVVGSEGEVVAFEIDEPIAARARENLAGWPNVHVQTGDGATAGFGEVDALLVNAGATHPLSGWIEALRDGGRMIVPLTIGGRQAGFGNGFVLRVERHGNEFDARFFSAASIFDCAGARDAGAESQLRDALGRGTWQAVRRVRIDPHELGEGCVIHTSATCVSKG